MRYRATSLQLLELSCSDMIMVGTYLDPAGNCDNCTAVKNERDLSKEIFLLLSCIKSCGGRWGLNLPIDVLRGSRVSLILVSVFYNGDIH